MLSEGFKLPTIFRLEQIVPGMFHIDFISFCYFLFSDEQISSRINPGTVYKVTSFMLDIFVEFGKNKF